MTKTYKPKSWYVMVINIAKGQLEIEEENYRAILKAKTGKQSLKEMGIPELFTVLEHMKKLGFKPTTSASKKKSPKSSDKAETTHTMLDKLRQIWIQMHYQGFINDGSETALQNWACKQSKRLNKGEPIAKLEWLNGQMLWKLIEQLKQWHMRLLGEVFVGTYNMMITLNIAKQLNTEQQQVFMGYAAQYNEAPHTHNVVAAAYSAFINIIEQQKEYVE